MKRHSIQASRILLVLGLAAIITQPGALRADSPDDHSVGIRGFADPAWGANTYSSPDALLHPAEIAKTGANWIAVGPALVMNKATDDAIYRDPQRTATDESLTRIIRSAHSHGLKVMMRPFVDCLDSRRGLINPTNRAVWFGWLRYWMNHYAALAQSLGVEMMSVGANFEKLSNDAKYLAVINQVRDRFSGKLVYDASIYEYQQISFWRLLDYVGIDAYWPLSPNNEYERSELLAAWSPITDELRALSERTGKKILFTEAGYRSITGAVRNPVDYKLGGTSDQAAQASAYDALLSANRQNDYFAGLFWWQWDIAGKLDQSRDYTPHRKTAQMILESGW